MFDVNKSTVKPENTDYIKQLALWLAKHPTIKLRISGHTDIEGNDVANKKLSEERAMAVKEALIGSGAKRDRISTKGYGATEPADSRNTTDAKAKNRRVVFELVE